MSKFSRIFSLAIMATVAAQAQVSIKIKWACVGNSITEGTTGATNAYPAKLAGKMLMMDVLNAGVGWRTMLRSGDSTYWKYGRFAQVFAFQPDIITIKLGTNDSKPINWKDSANFLRDTRDMIDTLAAMPSHPRIFIVYPTPCFNNEVNAASGTIRESVIRYGVIPRLRQVAIEKGLDTIDLHTPFLTKQSLFNADGIHLTTAGYDSIATYLMRGYVAKVTRIAVVGNSITEYINSGITGAVAVDAYPIKLNMLLGRNYYVENDGRSGCYAQKANGIVPAIMPYWTQSNGKLNNVFNLKPHIITISLGTNDSRPKAWNTARYITDYKALVDTFSNNISPKPQIWLVKPIGAWKRNGVWGFSNPSGTTDNGISGDIIRDSVVPAVTQIAADKGLPTIDLFHSAAFDVPNEPTAITNSDGVHPNRAGSDTMAHIFFRAMNLPTTGIQSQIAKSRVPSHDVRYINTSRKKISSVLRNPGGLHTLDGKAVQPGAPLSSGVYVTPHPQPLSRPTGEGSKNSEGK